MNYLEAIKTAIIIFPIIALIFTIPFILHQYHKYGSINKFRVLIIYSFILYLITIYSLVIFPLPNKSEINILNKAIQLQPFNFIKSFLQETSFNLFKPQTYFKIFTEPAFYTVAFNIIMTIPLGMYLRYYFSCSLKKTLIISFILSLFFEFTQLTGLYFIYPSPYRVFDVDDLIMNTLGAIIGYFIMNFIKGFLPSRQKMDEDAYFKGQNISGMKRITLFYLDCFLYIVFSLIMSLFIHKYVFTIMFIIYYVIYPILNNNQTIGSQFLNIRFQINNYKIIKLLFINEFLYLYYFGTIIIIFSLTMFISMYLELFLSIILYITITIFSLLFYAFNVIYLIKQKHMFYDKLFDIKYQSTVNKNK